MAWSACIAEVGGIVAVPDLACSQSISICDSSDFGDLYRWYEERIQSLVSVNFQPGPSYACSGEDLNPPQSFTGAVSHIVSFRAARRNEERSLSHRVRVRYWTFREQGQTEKGLTKDHISGHRE
jgi:hypothetical protein